MSLRVDQDRPVATAAPQRKFVNAEHSRRDNASIRKCAYQPQQSDATGRHRQAPTMATTGPTTEREADCFQHGAEARSTVRITSSEHRRLLNKRPTRTLRSKTSEPAYGEIDNRSPTGNRQIAKMAYVATVNYFRMAATTGAAGSRQATSDREMDGFPAD